MRNTVLAPAILALDRDGESVVTLERSHDGRLLARRGGHARVVHVRRCFPWSEPMQFLSLRDDDGEEFALLTDVEGLDEASRVELERALAEAGFMFDVTQVAALEEEVELRQWRVETKQGSRTFQTRLDDWPRVLPDGGLLIRDICGDLYRFANTESLDKRSRELLWAFVD